MEANVTARSYIRIKPQPIDTSSIVIQCLAVTLSSTKLPIARFLKCPEIINERRLSLFKRSCSKEQTSGFQMTWLCFSSFKKKQVYDNILSFFKHLPSFHNTAPYFVLVKDLNRYLAESTPTDLAGCVTVSVM